MTTIIPQILTQIADYKTPKSLYSTKPTNSFTRRRYVCRHHQQGFGFGFESKLLLSRFDDTKKKKKRVVVVRFNNLGLNGGGGGGKDDGSTGRVLGNLALAIGLTYLSFTGQLGWILDAIVSVWLLVVLVPIVGLVALVWWAGRDMVLSDCPSCGNEFEVFKSTLNEESQLCPYCNQPFSVVDDEFVKDPVKYSNGSTTFGEAFNNMSSRSKKGKKASASSRAVIDIEAEVKDID